MKDLNGFAGSKPRTPALFRCQWHQTKLLRQNLCFGGKANPATYAFAIINNNMSLSSPEDKTHIEPFRSENLPYTRLPDFPQIEELGIKRGEYVYLSREQSRVLTIGGDRTQATMGNILQCAGVVVLSDDSEAALAVHHGPDDPGFSTKLHEYLLTHPSQRAALMFGDIAGLSVWEVKEMLKLAGIEQITEIPIDSNGQYTSSFFDLNTKEFSAIGRNIQPAAAQSAGQYQRLVYRPFST